MCGQLAKHFGVKSKPARVNMGGEVTGQVRIPGEDTWQVKARWPERFGERKALGPGKDEAVVH